MRKLLLHTLLLVSMTGFSQDKAYQSTEDALTKLINNPEFVEDVLKLGTQEVNAANIDQYLTKYVPEYSGFKIQNNINLDKLYYANFDDVAPEMVADKLGGLLNLNPAQSQHMKNTLSGNLSYAPTNNLSSGISSKLYDRGKDAKLDYAVDYAVDFFQGEFGDGGFKSLGIDVAGGMVGYVFSGINKRYEEKMRQEKILTDAMSDYNIYNAGGHLADHKNTQQDLYVHSKAEGMSNTKFSIGKTMDYKAAIPLYDQAIAMYKKNPARAYFLFEAYQGRGKCKMQVGAYRSAIIDFYYAQTLLDNILSGRLPDRSVKTVWPDGYFDASNKKTYIKGKGEHTIGSLTPLNQVTVLVSRAYAKYRAGDFTGAIADCALAQQINSTLPVSGKANDTGAIISAVRAMAEFGSKDYAKSYATFAAANLTDALVADTDADGIVDFSDTEKTGLRHIQDDSENLGDTQYKGLPEYFPYDIAQIHGLACYKAGQIDKAITTYEVILQNEIGKAVYSQTEKRAFTKSGGDVSTVYASLGNFYVAKGDKQKALTYFDKAISIKPSQMEYYLSRANCKKLMGDKAGYDKDMAVVKKPESASAIKKTEEYYKTKIAEFESSKNNSAMLDLTREATTIYPKNQGFFNTLVKSTITENKPEKTQTAINAVAADKRKHAVLSAIYNRQTGNTAKEEEHIMAAFEDGLGLYEAAKVYPMQLNTRPYYCKLISKYATKTNNTFIAADFDKERMTRTLDSTYNSIPEYANATGFMKKMLDKSRKKEYAKALGNVDEYLAELNDDKTVTEMVSITSLDKIECLFILEKDAEAVKFAKKIVSAGKIVPLPDNPICNDALIGIQTIAQGQCQ